MSNLLQVAMIDTIILSLRQRGWSQRRIARERGIGSVTVEDVARELRERPLTRNEYHDHFKRVLAGTKWEMMRGGHVFRHSFCSNLAMKGVDQRIIDEFVGHQTEQQQKRYRHLAPNTKTQALKGVFG